MPFCANPTRLCSTALALACCLATVNCGGGALGPPPVTVLVSPQNATVLVAASQQFTARVTGTGSTAVTWSVNGVNGGNSSVGTISPTGLYAAPEEPPSANPVTVRATSDADRTRSASASVTIENPQPQITSISPSILDAGSGDTTLDVAGAGFAKQSEARAGTSSLVSSFVSETQLTATILRGQLETAGQLALTVVNPPPGGGTSNPVGLTVLVVVDVAPAEHVLSVGETLQFTASVIGTTDGSVTWFVNDVAGGDSSLGTIDPTGLYTAPETPPTPNAVTIRAVSVADPSCLGSALLTLVNPWPQVSAVEPSTIRAGSAETMLAVTGAGFTPQSNVMLGDHSLATSFMSSTQLTATVPGDELASAGVFPVSVATPAPGGGTSAPLDLQVLVAVSVSPTAQTLNVEETQQFAATVVGTSNGAVSWMVNDVVGGDPSVGAIDTTGLYTAPATPPVPNVVTITAASAADPAQTASATVTVVNPAPQLGAVSPSIIDAGSGDTLVSVVGSGFSRQSSVQAGTTPLATSYVSPTQLSATLPGSHLATAGEIPITVETPGPGGGTSNPVALTVVIVVGVTPSAQTLNVGQTHQFVATVTGSPDQGVSWWVNDIEGGNAVVGTIDVAGLYTAPATPPTPNTVTLKAVSVVDPSRAATASVTVVNPVPTLVSISPTTVDAGSPDTTLTVTGADFTPQSMVQLDDILLATAFESGTQLTALVPAAELTSPGTLPVTVMTPGPGGGTSNPVDLTVRALVAVSPSQRTLSVNQTQQFTATVAESSDQSVTWSVNDIPGGDATVGTISETGIYIAPAAVPVPDSVTVKATSVADPAKSGTALVTVTLPESDNYPRPDAGSVLRPSPPLTLIPIEGSTVAVLDWTAKDEYGTEEDLLAVCHSFTPSGIPHIHTTSLAEASSYPFIAVAGVLDLPSRLTDAERDDLMNYVQNGGTLFLWQPSDPGLLTRLGLTILDSHVGTVVRPVDFDPVTLDPSLRYIDHDVEIHWQLSYPDYALTLGYDAGPGVTLGSWETGEAAVLRRDLGTGRAYIFGWRLRHILTEAETLVVPGQEPPWVNVPVLDADICRLLVRGAYEGWAGATARIRQFAPEGKHAALIVTHDVDDQTSYDRTPEFAELESQLGFKATFNMTTSSYDTGWLDAFYNTGGMEAIRQALNLGHDVESHSLGHFPDFAQAPFGSGTETAANYMPQYSWDLYTTIGFSTLGEMGVSRWLLENDFGITVEGFRSGYLCISDGFLEALRQTGYRRDSTYAAGVTRGSFPFVAFEVYSGSVTTYPIVEYPMTLEDADLTDETLTQIVDAWVYVIQVNYDNNVPTVLNIHPVSEGPRREALEELLQRIADLGLDLWIGDWKTFAEFWETQGVTCEGWP